MLDLREGGVLPGVHANIVLSVPNSPDRSVLGRRFGTKFVNFFERTALDGRVAVLARAYRVHPIHCPGNEP